MRHKHHKLNKKRFIVVFIITLAVFVIGMYIGSLSTDLKFQKVDNVGDSLRLDILGLDMQYSLISDNPCLIFNDTTLSMNLDEMGRKVVHLENKVGTDDVQFKNLKIYYSLLQLKHWQLKKRALRECSEDKTVILYFYSNDCESCKSQGIVLSNVRKVFDELSVYSIDASLDNAALTTLKSMYNIDDEFPVLVINDEVYKGYKSKDDLVDILLD